MEVSQALIDKIFSQLRIIHNAHWKVPKLEDVQKEIARTGAFVFRIGADPHVAEVRIGAEISYVINEALPARMLKQAQEYKNKFDALSFFRSTV